MAATVKIYRYIGNSPVGSDITSINTRGATADIATPNDTDFPIRIPASGTNYSYWISVRLVTLSAPNGLINNIVWFTDGSNGLGTGVGIVAAKASTGANAGYRQAVGTPGTTGVSLSQAHHSGLDAEPVDAFRFVQADPLIVGGSTSGIGPFGDYVVYQFTVAATAEPGTVVPEQFTFQYDET